MEIGASNDLSISIRLKNLPNHNKAHIRIGFCQVIDKVMVQKVCNLGAESDYRSGYLCQIRRYAVHSLKSLRIDAVGY